MFLLWHHTYIRVANIPKSASEHVTVKSLPRSHFLPPPSLFTFTMLKVYLSSAICDIFSLKSVSNAKQKQNKIKRNKKSSFTGKSIQWMSNFRVNFIIREINQNIRNHHVQEYFCFRFAMLDPPISLAWTFDQYPIFRDYLAKRNILKTEMLCEIVLTFESTDLHTSDFGSKFQTSWQSVEKKKYSSNYQSKFYYGCLLWYKLIVCNI